MWNIIDIKNETVKEENAMKRTVIHPLRRNMHVAYREMIALHNELVNNSPVEFKTNKNSILVNSITVYNNIAAVDDQTEGMIYTAKLQEVVQQGYVPAIIELGNEGDMLISRVIFEEPTTDARLYGYHDSAAPKVQAPGEGMFFGCELETYAWYQEDFEGALKEVYVLEGFKAAEFDGSIVPSEWSFECISQPMKKKAMEQYLVKLAKILDDNNCDCNKSCGLHFHVSKNALTDKQLVAMILTVDKCYNELIEDGDREKEHANRYCRNPLRRILPAMKQVTAENMVKNYKCTDHAYALNIKNEHTVELRTYGGTLSPLGLVMALNVFYAIIKLCEDGQVHEWDEVKKYAYKEVQSC